MDTKYRRQQLYEYLKKNQEIYVADFARMMGVSCMTIRRDLASLEQEGLIARSYGKAQIVNDTANEHSFFKRLNDNYDFKLAACAEAVRQLPRDATIFVDGSTTSYVLCTLIPPGWKMNIIVSNLSAAMVLREHANIQLIFPGGYLANDRNSINIESSQYIPGDLYVDAAIVSCGGFSEKGPVDSNLSGAYVRESMCRNAQQVIMIADHTKYRKQGLFSPWKWSDIDLFVTDLPPCESMQKALERERVRLHLPG